MRKAGVAIATLKSEIFGMFPNPETIEQQEVEPSLDAQVGVNDFCTPTPSPKPESESIGDRAEQAKGDYYQLVQTSNTAIAYFKRYDGASGSVYIGGMSQSRLQAWADWLYSNEYTIHNPILREAKRLSNWRYEVKLPTMFITYLDDLSELDFSRYPAPSPQVLA